MKGLIAMGLTLTEKILKAHLVDPALEGLV